MINEINIKEFISSTKMFQGTGAQFSHTMCKGTLQNYSGEWFCKEIKDPANARLELLAQELFRVITPYQPRTLIAKNYTNHTYYVLSQEVPGYCNLPNFKGHNFANGKYQGLGRAVVAAMYLQETDLKNGNIGLDNQNRVIKIDGDRCFSQFNYGLKLNQTSQYKLTSEGIDALPRPVDFPANQWLNFIIKGKRLPLNDRIVEASLSYNAGFRAEVNQSLYRICLLPDRFIEAIVDAYMPAGGQRFVNLLKARRDELQKSAFYNPSFAAYLKTKGAKKDANQFLEELIKFENFGKFTVKAKNVKKLEKDFKNNRNFPIKVQCTRLVEDCDILLQRIDSFRILPDDPFMDEGIALYKEKIRQCAADLQQLNDLAQRLRKICTNVCGAQDLVKKIAQHKLGAQDNLMDTTVQRLYEEISKTVIEPEKIMELKPRLTALLTSVNSKEIVAVTKTVSSLRHKAGFFSVGIDKKADNIETALLNTPIQERGTVISSDAVTAVQEAIATHRYLGSRGDVYKTKDGKIDPKRAPSLFNTLKAGNAPKVTKNEGIIEKQSTILII